MALSRRETRILYATLAVVVGATLWTIGIAPLWERFAAEQEVLASERAKYLGNVKTLDSRREIEEGFSKIEASFPKDDPEGRAPEDAFSEDVMYAAQNILPGRVPQAGRVEYEKIEGVPGYEFLTFPITTRGELENIALLLKGFDQKGFLIKSLTLTHAKNIDDPELQVEITLARVVKLDEGDAGFKPTVSRRPRTGGRR
jgi:hypothetical protein